MNYSPNIQPPAPTGPVMPPDTQNQKRAKREGLNSIIAIVVILLIAPILAMLITGFVFQSYQVDGPSMESTLQSNDRLIIWKAGRTWSRLTKENFVPKRGEIIVFVKKGLYDFSSDKEKQLIKRVIGLPGERVVVENGAITVFNDENPNGFNPDTTLGYSDQLVGETINNVDIRLNDQEVFVAGDHRDNSLDSRSFGGVPLNDIVGSLAVRILPLSGIQRF